MAPGRWRRRRPGGGGRRGRRRCRDGSRTGTSTAAATGGGATVRHPRASVRRRPLPPPGPPLRHQRLVPLVETQFRLPRIVPAPPAISPSPRFRRLPTPLLIARRCDALFVIATRVKETGALLLGDGRDGLRGVEGVLDGGGECQARDVRRARRRPRRAESRGAGGGEAAAR